MSDRILGTCMVRLGSSYGLTCCQPCWFCMSIYPYIPFFSVSKPHIHMHSSCKGRQDLTISVRFLCVSILNRAKPVNLSESRVILKSPRTKPLMYKVSWQSPIPVHNVACDFPWFLNYADLWNIMHNYAKLWKSFSDWVSETSRLSIGKSRNYATDPPP